MAKIILAIFATLTLSCEPKPDMQDGNVRVWWDGHQPLMTMIPAMNVIFEDGLAACPDPQKLVAAWCAEVYWQDYPFAKCDGISGPLKGYAGCQPLPGSCEVWVGWKPHVADTALADEMAHYIWEVCYGNTGESCATAYPDGGYTTCPDSGYAAFVAQLHQDLQTLR